jgi:oligoribonuclease (3'-5' exoribonuclease)
MKFIVIDIETTGINTTEDDILSISAVIEDTKELKPIEELPKFNYAILHERITGNPFALNMNKELISKISNRLLEVKSHKPYTECDIDFTYLDIIKDAFLSWLFRNNIGYETQTYAGKNIASFDIPFLKNRIPGWAESISMKQRTIDPAILCVDWENDIEMPNLQKCMDRTIEQGIVTHDGLQDCYDTLQVIRKITKNYTVKLF